MVNNNVISLDFKETSMYESPSKDVLPHFLTPSAFPKNLRDIRGWKEMGGKME